MAETTKMKVIQYKVESDKRYPFCIVNNEVWTTLRVVVSLFDISNKKLKQIESDIRTQTSNEKIFKAATVSSKDFPEAGYTSAKVILYNISAVLAVGFRVDNEKATRLHKWISGIMKKEGIYYQSKLDPDITGCGRIYIQYGEMQEAIYNTEVYFENTYHPEWLQDPYVKKMIKDIDRAEVLDRGLIMSPILGQIPPSSLSGGVKTLILLYRDHSQIYNVSTCGDNCAKGILDIAKKHNLTINLHHIMDFGERDFDAVILNNKKSVCNMVELVQYAGYYV